MYEAKHIKQDFLFRSSLHAFQFILNDAVLIKCINDFKGTLGERLG